MDDLKNLNPSPISAITNTTVDISSFCDKIKTRQLNDTFCQELDKYLQSPDLIPYLKKGFVKSFEKKDNVWYYCDNVIVIPKGELQLKLLEHFHNCIDHGHKGIRKTYQSMVEIVYWKELLQDVEKFVSSCSSCQRALSTSNPHGLLKPLEIPDERFESVCNMDFKPLPISIGIIDVNIYIYI